MKKFWESICIFFLLQLPFYASVVTLYRVGFQHKTRQGNWTRNTPKPEDYANSMLRWPVQGRKSLGPFLSGNTVI